MIENLFSMVFLPFQFPPVQIACCMSFVVALLMLLRRLLTGEYVVLGGRK